MGKYLLTLGIAAVLAMMLVPYTAQAKPDNEICTGTLSGNINKNVKVPKGATCLLQFPLTITGNVDVKGNLEEDADTPGIRTIDGNLKANGAGSISLTSTNITGDLKVNGGKTSFNFGDGTTRTIGGDVRLHGNTFAEIHDTEIGGDLKIGGGKAVIISEVHVAGDAHCKGPNVTGFGNTYGNNKNDSCPGEV